MRECVVATAAQTCRAHISSGVTVTVCPSPPSRPAPPPQGLPLSLDLSWLEQKAVIILLSLLHLNVKNIRIGPKAPAFLTPEALQVRGRPARAGRGCRQGHRLRTGLWQQDGAQPCFRCIPRVIPDALPVAAPPSAGDCGEVQPQDCGRQAPGGGHEGDAGGAVSGTGAQRNSRQLEQQPAGQAVVAKAAQQRTKAGRGFKCGQPVCIPTVIDKHEQVDNSSAGVT